MYALERANKYDIPAYTLLSKDYKTSREYEDELIFILEKHDVDLVVLAGFIKVLSPYFVSKFTRKIVNIHPSLIPSFCGRGFYGKKKVHEAVIEYGVKITGVTVHFVDEGRYWADYSSKGRYGKG